MKTLVAIIAAAVGLTCAAQADVIASWTFTVTTPAVITSQVANTVGADMATGGAYNDLTRGPGAPPNAANNSFRSLGFQNNGLSLTNTDYFKVVVSADAGYDLSLSDITAVFAGTTTFANSPGVDMRWGYSLDGGTTFNWAGAMETKVGTATTPVVFDLSGVAALQNVTGDVELRFYATGQTSTGSWGFFSPTSAGGQAPGLTINGTTGVVPEPSVFALFAIGGLAATRFARRRKG